MHMDHIQSASLVLKAVNRSMDYVKVGLWNVSMFGHGTPF